MKDLANWLLKHHKLVVIAAGLAVIFAGVVVGAFYIRTRYFTPERMSGMITAQIKKHMARDFKFKSVQLTRTRGLEFEGVSLKGNSALAGGDFLRADLVIMDTNMRALMAGRVELECLTVKNPSLVIKRSAAGVWSFDDMLALRDPTKASRPVAVMEIENGLLKLDDELTATSLVFTGVNGIYKYSGTDQLKLESNVNGIFRGAKISGVAVINCGLRFDGIKFTGTEGSIKISGLLSDGMDADKLDFTWELKDFDKPLYKRGIDASVSADGVVLKGLGRARPGAWEYWVAMPFKVLSSFQGACIPDLNLLKVDSFKSKFRQRGGQWETVEFKVEGPDLNIDFEGCVDPAQKKADFKFDLKAASVGLNLSVWGPLDKPEFKPEVSATVGGGIRESLFRLSEFLGSAYPVNTAGIGG